jgi:hypothetical protein
MSFVGPISRTGRAAETGRSLPGEAVRAAAGPGQWERISTSDKVVADASPLFAVTIRRYEV